MDTTKAIKEIAMKNALGLMGAVTGMVQGGVKPDRRIDHSKDIHKPKDKAAKAKRKRQMVAASRKNNR